MDVVRKGRKERYLEIVLSSLVLAYFLNKLLFNPAGQVSGGFSGNIFLVLNGVVTLSLFLWIYLQKKHLTMIPVAPFLTIILAFHVYALLSTSYSKIPVISFYQSIAGFLYGIAGVIFAESIILKTNSYQSRVFLWVKCSVLFSVAALASNAIYFAVRGQLDLNSFFIVGIPSDFVVVIFLTCAFYNIRRRVYGVELIVCLLGAFLGKSFSSLAAFLVALLFLAALRGKIIAFIITLGGVLWGGVLFINYLKSMVGTLIINGKSAEAYLSGSGRFDVYANCWSVYTEEFSRMEQLFGRGFMAERYSLDGRGLTWTIDAHSTFFQNLLGLGVLGVGFLLVFYVVPVIQFRNIRGIEVDTFLVFHLASIGFGLTSSQYLSRPSFLIIFSLSLYLLICVQLKKYLVK